MQANLANNLIESVRIMRWG